MKKQDEATFKLEDKEKNTGATKKSQARVLVMAVLAVVLVAVVLLSQVWLSGTGKLLKGPTTVDGQKQEQALRKKRQESERRLGEMEDKLIEKPGVEKYTHARESLEDIGRLGEQEKTPENQGLETNVSGYQPFDSGLDDYRKLQQVGKGRANSGVDHLYRGRVSPGKKSRRKSMEVISDEETKNRAFGTPDCRTEEELARDERAGKTDDWPNYPAEDESPYPEENHSPAASTASSINREASLPIFVRYNHDFPLVTLYEGEFLEGIILNEIRSDIQEGPVTVKISRDFYDDSGVYVIIPYGTTVVGSTQKVTTTSQARLYIRFERLILPVRKSNEMRASITLPAGVTALDQKGINGVVSKVNRHFWQKYGSALLLGVIDGLSGLAQKNWQKDSWSILIDEPGQNLSSVNDSWFNRYGNIMPTVSIKPGTRIKVYLAGDIHISAYDLIENRPYYRAGGEHD